VRPTGSIQDEQLFWISSMISTGGRAKKGPAACGAAGPTIQQPTTIGTVSRNAKPRKPGRPWSAKKNLNRRLNVKKFLPFVNLDRDFSKKQRLFFRFENEK